jgi:hypothetical protein
MPNTIFSKATKKPAHAAITLAIYGHRLSRKLTGLRPSESQELLRRELSQWFRRYERLSMDTNAGTPVPEGLEESYLDIICELSRRLSNASHQ